MPRCCFSGNGEHLDLKDATMVGHSTGQAEAVAKITKYDDGLICAPTAFGKTEVAAWLIAKRAVNTLVLVHRQQLLDQWRERLVMFLDTPIDQIGQVGGGKTKRTGVIDVAVIQSLHREREVKDFVAEYGHVIVDECHTSPRSRSSR
jgi:superfamily II DNA or RNA helicase